MSLIHLEGRTCTLGELDLHSLPISQKDFLHTRLGVSPTNNALTGTSTSFKVTFEANMLYTDLAEVEIYLEVTHQLVNGDYLKVEVEALHLLFETVQMSIVRKWNPTMMSTLTKPTWKTCSGPRQATKRLNFRVVKTMPMSLVLKWSRNEI